MKTKLLTPQAVEKIDIKILETLGKKDKYWSAKSLAKRYKVNVEKMEHYMVEMAQQGKVAIGTDREGNLYVGSRE